MYVKYKQPGFKNGAVFLTLVKSKVQYYIIAAIY